MNRLTLALSFLLNVGLLSAVPASAQASAPSSAAPATAAEPVSSTASTPSPADIDAAAVHLAKELGGVLRNCPAAYASIGTPDKRCVGLSGDVDTVRGLISTALGEELYGVWRSRDDQRTVFNWVKMPSAAVYVRVAADETAGRSLIYLDAPTVPAAALNTPTQAMPTMPTSKPAPSASTTTASLPIKRVPAPISKTFQAPSANTNGTTKKAMPATKLVTSTSSIGAKSLAPVVFSRALELKSPRLSGPDVLAAQNRLIALTLGGQGGKGDGWYGPNTAKTVRDFQTANSLKVTGVLDKATWETLFLPGAKKFKAAGQ